LSCVNQDWLPFCTLGIDTQSSRTHTVASNEGDRPKLKDNLEIQAEQHYELQDQAHNFENVLQAVAVKPKVFITQNIAFFHANCYFIDLHFSSLHVLRMFVIKPLAVAGMFTG